MKKKAKAKQLLTEKFSSNKQGLNMLWIFIKYFMDTLFILALSELNMIHYVNVMYHVCTYQNKAVVEFWVSQ